MGQNGPSAPSYWTYNRFSNNGFGGLNWYYGPLGGYTPYVTPYGSTTYGYPYFGPYYSYVPLAPVIRQTRPYWIGGDPLANGAAGNANNNRGAQANGVDDLPPAQQPVQPNVKIFGKAPTTDALRRSIRYQAQGDEWFGKQNYLQAFGHYKDAITAAPARTEPRFRKALALAATTNYSLAVEEIKRSMQLDPTWPQTGPQLDELFGADNILSKNALLHKVAAWVREDIRDPDRLFLMGVLLHFNNDRDKSHTFFEAASALAPVPFYAQAFLEAEERQHAGKPPEEPRPAPPDEEPAEEPARVQPAGGLIGPRFPADAGVDDGRPLPESPAKGLAPRPGLADKVATDKGATANGAKGKGSQIAPGNGPANRFGPAPRSAPVKAPEEPRPRPLAGNGVEGGARHGLVDQATFCSGIRENSDSPVGLTGILTNSATHKATSSSDDVNSLPRSRFGLVWDAGDIASCTSLEHGERMARLLVASRPDRPSGTVGPPDRRTYPGQWA